MRRCIVAGMSNRPLTDRIISVLDETAPSFRAETFPDGELYVRIDADLVQSDVYVIQGTGPPPAENLMELLLLGDACRRAGAARLTAVLPYFGYARQDRRAMPGEAVGARMVADMIATRYQRVLCVDLHAASVEGFFSIAVEHLSAVDLLAEALRTAIPRQSVAVAPDRGAANLAGRYAELLQLPIAYVNKIRHSGESVEALSLTGEVKDRSAVIVDDMISTGGTVAAAIKMVLEKGCTPPVYVAASHGLFAANARERLARYPIERIFVSDSLPDPPGNSMPIERARIGRLIADRIEAMSAGCNLAL